MTETCPDCGLDDCGCLEVGAANSPGDDRRAYLKRQAEQRPGQDSTGLRILVCSGREGQTMPPGAKTKKVAFKLWYEGKALKEIQNDPKIRPKTRKCERMGSGLGEG